jgi:hypothetical protein
MVGNPKYLNTKYDYEYVRENFDNWREYWQELYDSRIIWQNVELVGDGIEDDTHRIVQSQDEVGNPVTIQQELQVDLNAKLFRIGLTEGEVAAALVF